MDKDKLQRLLNSIGKRCFENCYEIACEKGESLTKEDLVKHDPQLKGTLETGMRTRLSAIKRIFRDGSQVEALRIAKNRTR